MCGGPVDDTSAYELLFKLLEWPDDVVFPVLDIVRIAVKDQTNNEVIVALNDGSIIEKLKRYVSESCKVVNNTIVALRAICNFCTHQAGENLVFNHR